MNLLLYFSFVFPSFDKNLPKYFVTHERRLFRFSYLSFVVVVDAMCCALGSSGSLSMSAIPHCIPTNNVNFISTEKTQKSLRTLCPSFFFGRLLVLALASLGIAWYGGGRIEDKVKPLNLTEGCRTSSYVNKEYLQGWIGFKTRFYDSPLFSIF